MAIENMVLLNMTFDCSKIDQVLFHLKDSQNFYPQVASKIVNNVKEVGTLKEDDTFTILLDQLIDVASYMKLDLHDDFVCEHSFNKENVEAYLKNLENEIKKIKKVQDELILEKEENNLTLTMLEQLSLSQVNLDQLMNCRYVKTRFGRLKRQNLDKIKYYDTRPFIFNKLGEDHQYVWCCYIVSENLMLEVDNIFMALGFEEVKVPSFVHGTLEDAKEELKNEINAMEEYILRMDQKTSILRETHKIDLLKLYSSLCFFKKMEAYKSFVVDYQRKYAIYGFIPSRKVQELKEYMRCVEGIEYQELPNSILENQDINAPTVIHNAKFVKPFEMMSKVKQSDKIDTSVAFAALYYAVFCLFLGDLGVGAIMALLGLLTRKKNVSKTLLSLSIATLIGGLLYGTAFYTISLYSTIVFPLSTIYRIVDGIILLIVGTYTINAFKKMYIDNSLVDRVLSMKGICGLICIYALLAYLIFAYEIHVHISMKPFAIVAVVCLLMIMMKSMIKKKLSK